MNKIIVYSTGCPRCNVLKAKLDQLNIQYDVETDKDLMISLGMQSAPAMSVNGGKLMNFNESIKWIKGHQNG